MGCGARTRAPCMCARRWAARGAGGPAQLVPQDGFSAARRGRITLPAQLASRGAAAGGVRGPPSGPTAPAGAQGVGAAAGGRAAWAVAPRAGSACCPPCTAGRTWEAGRTAWAWVWATTAACPRAQGELAGDPVNAVGVRQGAWWRAHGSQGHSLQAGALGKALGWLEPQQPPSSPPAAPGPGGRGALEATPEATAVAPG